MEQGAAVAAAATAAAEQTAKTPDRRAAPQPLPGVSGLPLTSAGLAKLQTAEQPEPAKKVGGGGRKRNRSPQGSESASKASDGGGNISWPNRDLLDSCV